MSDSSANLAFFSGTTIRRVWHTQEWWYVIVDVIAMLTESPQPSVYWRQQKSRMRGEGAAEALEAIIQLPMRAADNRLRQTDLANRETLLRIIQRNSIKGYSDYFAP